MTKNDMVLFTRFGMGDAPTELQKRLVGVFLTLVNQDTPPGIVAFYGEGVKLACDTSPVLDALRTLEERGSRLIVCQTCIDYYEIRDRLRVGIIGGMGDIVHAMSEAAKVISV